MTNQHIDIIVTYVLPSYFLFGSLINTINSIIFSSAHSDFQTQIYQYLKINSIIDAVNLAIASASTLVLNLEYRRSYIYQIYYFYIVLFLSRVLNLVSSLINIKIAIDRFIFLKKQKPSTFKIIKKSSKNINFHIALFFVFAIAYNFPNLVFFEIIVIRNDFLSTTTTTTTTTIRSNQSIEYNIIIGDSSPAKRTISKILFLLQYAITFINLFLMVIITALTYKIIRKKYKNYSIQLKIESNDLIRSKLNRRMKRTGEKTSILVLWASVIFIVNELVTALGSIMHIGLKKMSPLVNATAIFVTTVYVTTCTVNILLYGRFNHTFAIKFKKILCMYFV